MTDVLIDKEMFRTILNSISKPDLIRLFSPDDVIYNRWRQPIKKDQIIEEILLHIRKTNYNDGDIAYCRDCKMLKKVNKIGYCESCDKKEEKPHF